MYKLSQIERINYDRQIDMVLQTDWPTLIDIQIDYDKYVDRCIYYDRYIDRWTNYIKQILQINGPTMMCRQVYREINEPSMIDGATKQL